MKKTTIILAGCAGVLLIASISTLHAADWKLPLQIKAGTAMTAVTVGTATTATDGYDNAFDIPAPADAATLDAYIPHPEWSVTMGGKQLSNFHQDIRSEAAQTFEITVKSTATPVSVTWDPSILPKQSKVMLVDGTNGALIDMKTAKSYSLKVTGTAKLILVAEQPDTTAPAPPEGIMTNPGIRPNSMQVRWTANSEADLAGYRIKIGTSPGQWERTVDLKNVLNYNLFDLVPGQAKYVVLSGYDKSGNESGASAVAEVLISLPPVNGVCGTSYNGIFTSMPTSGLCASGAAIDSTGNGHPWNWNCSGAGTGSTTATCKAWIKTWAVNFSSGAGGTINGPVSQTVDHGADAAAVTAVASAGYTFSSWTGSASSTVNPLSLSAVTSEMNVTSLFVVTPAGTILGDGDIDGDGRVTIKDALMVIRSVVGLNALTAAQAKHADLYPIGNPDGKLTIHDGIVILRKALGLK